MQTVDAGNTRHHSTGDETMKMMAWVIIGLCITSILTDAVLMHEHLEIVKLAQRTSANTSRIEDAVLDQIRRDQLWIQEHQAK